MSYKYKNNPKKIISFNLDCYFIIMTNIFHYNLILNKFTFNLDCYFIIMTNIFHYNLILNKFTQFYY